MEWVLGIDEAGYGPNLGPFVMTAVAARVPDGQADLWLLLQAVLRRSGEPRDERILVDDSKVVYGSGKGLGGLERGVFAVLGLPPLLLGELIARLCPAAAEELAREIWFAGTSALPIDAALAELEQLRQRFELACRDASVDGWWGRSVVVCPERFNALVQSAGSKGAVLADGFVRLLAAGVEATAGEEALAVFVDKQGGRNTYAAQVQQALPGGMVVAIEERAERSKYRVFGLGRDMTLTFEPRADSSRLCVALASMVSKYLRELFMGEFNRFWQKHVPGLLPTAGYPGDAPRFLEAIRPAAASLQVSEAAIWRER
jgi:ribonuclease HII